MQRAAGVLKPQTLLLVLTGFLLIGWGMAVTPAHADTISSQTAQVLPTGGTACPHITTSNLTPYIYDGALHSFEFTVPDTSYVAVAGSVGNTGLPFYLMTRWGAPASALKVHVDIETTLIEGTLPLTVTLLSAHGAGQPVCVTTVSMSVVKPGAVQTAPASSSGTPATPPTSSTYTPAQTSGGNTNTGKQGAISGGTAETPGIIGAPGNEGIEPSNPVSENATGVAQSATLGSLQSLASKACATAPAAQRTWLILLLAYALIVGLALWAEYPLSLPSMRTPERVAAITLVLLLLLLGFWYFSADCRTALWMPLAAVLIAVLGLLAAFRNHPRVMQLLPMQNTKISS